MQKIFLFLIVVLLCSCSNKSVGLNDLQIKEEYCFNHEIVEGYDLHISENKKFCIQIPQEAKVLNLSQDSVKISFQHNNEPTDVFISYSNAANDSQYKNAEDVINDYENSGLHFVGDIVDFKRISHSSGIDGCQFIQVVNEDEKSYGWMYRVYYGNENDTIFVQGSLDNLDDETLLYMENIFNSLEILKGIE